MLAGCEREARMPTYVQNLRCEEAQAKVFLNS
jgi:hypothetical protein